MGGGVPYAGGGDKARGRVGCGGAGWGGWGEDSAFRAIVTPRAFGIVSLMLAKDGNEHPVPEALRPRFQALVAAFVAGDFELSSHMIEGISPIDRDGARFIAGQVAAYGGTLAPLSDEAWQRSVYLWMDGYWDVLIDLSTTEESVSDLVLHARLFGDQSGRIEVWSVHVP